MYYNGIILIEAAEHGKYVVGVDSVFKSSYKLSNHKVVKNRRLVVDMNMNPWGVKGETYQEIFNYFSKDEPLKYYQANDKIAIYHLGLKPSYKHDKGEESGYIGGLLQRKNIAEDLEKLGNNSIKIKEDKEFFQMPDGYESVLWRDILFRRFPRKATHFISKDILLDDDYAEEIKKPYYYIEISKEVRSTPDKLGKFSLMGISEGEPQFAFLQKDCLQFDSEEEAIEYALKYCGDSFKIKGFEIKISEDADMPEYIYYKGK